MQSGTGAINYFAGVTSVVNTLNLGGGSSTSEFRLFEASGNGNNYTALKAPDALADNTLVYTLPSTAPTNGQVLTWNTGGLLTWEDSSGGGDGNGIYDGSGTIPSGTIATLTDTLTFTGDVANTTSTADRLIIQTNSTDTAANGFGGNILFQGESSNTNNRDMMRLQTYWVDATDSSRTTAAKLYGVNNAGSLTEFLRIGPPAPANATSMSIGGGTTAYSNSGISAIGAAYTINSFTNTLSILSAATSTSALSLTNNNQSVNASGSIGNINGTNTSGDKYDWRMSSGYSVSSGTGTFTNLYFNGTINQTGTASGITRSIRFAPTLSSIVNYRALEFSPSYTASSGSGATTALNISPTYNLTGSASGIQRGLYINPTLTSLVSQGQFRGVDIAVNSSNSYGLYQSGSSAFNLLAGTTYIGGGTAPSELRFYEASASGTNYTGFKGPNSLTDDSLIYTLPSDTPTNGQVLTWNTGGLLTWEDSSGGGDGNGIYDGNGDVPASTTATLLGTFTIDNQDSEQVIIGDASLTGQALSLLPTGSRLGTADYYFLTFSDDEYVEIKGGDSSMSVATGGINAITPVSSVINTASSLGATFVLYEGTANGSNYTGFTAPSALSASLSYILPTSATDGYFLKYNSSGNQLEWADVGSGDGNGIYDGSGTVPASTTATVTSGSDFKFAYDGGNTAIRVYDALGSASLLDKTTTASVSVNSIQAGIAFDSNSFIIASTYSDLNNPLRINSGYLALDASLTPSTITSNQNNYAPTGINTASSLRLATDASRNITGIPNGGAIANGRVLVINNIGSFDIVLTDEDASSTAANRFALGDDYTIGPSQAVTLIYDTSASRWRPIHPLTTSGGGSGDILDGGNTNGAAITIGTNDAFGLNLETNNVTRLAITGGASTGGQVTITDVSSSSSAVEDVLTIINNPSTGTPNTSFGTALLFKGKSATVDSRDMARLAAMWTTAADASREAKLSVQIGDNAGALTEIANFSTAGTSSGTLSIGSSSALGISNFAFTTAQAYTLGNSSNNLTVGGASGPVLITSSATTGTAVQLNTTGNTATSTGSITINNGTTFTQTSGTRNIFNFSYSFAPTSGSAVHNSLNMGTTINQTGGASGIVRGMNLIPTLTAVADYRGIELTYSGADTAGAWGIYQTNSDVLNHFNGHLLLGTTTNQTGYNLSSAGPIRTEDGHVLVRGNGTPASDTGAAAIRLINTVGSEIFDLGVQDDDVIYIGTGNVGQVATIDTTGILNADYGITGPGTSQVIIKTADETVNNSGTLQDDNELTFTALANKKYVATFHLFLEDQDWFNTGMIFNVSVPSATSVVAAAVGGESDKTQVLVTTTGGSGLYILSSSPHLDDNGYVTINCYIDPGASNRTVTLQ